MKFNTFYDYFSFPIKIRNKGRTASLSPQAFSALRKANICQFASENSIIALRIHCKKLEVYRFNIL